MNCSDCLFDCLITRGVTDIFGYTGGYILPFVDALYGRRDEISVHVCYHEQACAFAVNALGGLADDWLDSVPVMVICGNVSANEQKGYSGIRRLLRSSAGLLPKRAVKHRTLGVGSMSRRLERKVFLGQVCA